MIAVLCVRQGPTLMRKYHISVYEHAILVSCRCAAKNFRALFAPWRSLCSTVRTSRAAGSNAESGLWHSWHCCGYVMPGLDRELSSRAVVIRVRAHGAEDLNFSCGGSGV
jgi:hypothetical protein